MKPVRIYGTRWCPDCRRAKMVLEKHHIPFDWTDIEQDRTACAVVEKINQGYRSVPTIVFPDGSVMVEPDNAALEKKLMEMA